MKPAAAACAELAGRVLLGACCVLCGCFAVAGTAHAQSRVAILQAEDRRAPTPADLAVLRSGTRSDDPQTRRIAIRAVGRLERPSLIPDLVPALKHPLPEVRAEAANAIAQAAQGWRSTGERAAADARALTTAQSTLVARLKIEADADVRAALCESIGRLPYASRDDVERAAREIVAAPAESLTDRVGVAKGLNALVATAGRMPWAQAPVAVGQSADGGPLEQALLLLRRWALPSPRTEGARVRRLAVETLKQFNDTGLTADADEWATDSDPQVRRLAMSRASAAVVRRGLDDPSPIVRLEAVRATTACDERERGTRDPDMHVVLAALDALGRCGESADAMTLLERTIDDVADGPSARGWPRAAHALVALANASTERAAARLPRFAASPVWQLRMYAARAAATLRDRATLEKLASADDNDNVREAAIDALRKIAGHDADEIYVANLSRPGYQAVRAAALALVGTPHPDVAKPALEAARQRLESEGRDNSHDARAAVLTALRIEPARGALARQRRPAGIATERPDVVARELKRLASPRARITIRDVGAFELALFTSVAPLTVLKFASLAESGYYNGLTFHRVVPNFVIQGGSPGANEYVGDAMFMRDEVGLWPHVRGAVGISTRGRDTGDAQIFIDLVDNPRLDHLYTVFAQVLNGMDVVDRILEGDVIERIDIIP